MDGARYIAPEQRAAWLIEKGVQAWQEVQHLAMSEDELLDSVVLLGQQLWMPHHETDGALFRVTLRLAVHYPEAGRAAAEARVKGLLAELERKHSDDRGTVAFAADTR
jgi:hypothetical protein